VEGQVVVDGRGEAPAPGVLEPPDGALEGRPVFGRLGTERFVVGGHRPEPRSGRSRPHAPRSAAGLGLPARASAAVPMLALQPAPDTLPQPAHRALGATEAPADLPGRI